MTLGLFLLLFILCSSGMFVGNESHAALASWPPESPTKNPCPEHSTGLFCAWEINALISAGGSLVEYYKKLQSVLECENGYSTLIQTCTRSQVCEIVGNDRVCRNANGTTKIDSNKTSVHNEKKESSREKTNNSREKTNNSRAKQKNSPERKKQIQSAPKLETTTSKPHTNKGTRNPKKPQTVDDRTCPKNTSGLRCAWEFNYELAIEKTPGTKYFINPHEIWNCTNQISKFVSDCENLQCAVDPSSEEKRICVSKKESTADDLESTTEFATTISLEESTMFSTETSTSEDLQTTSTDSSTYEPSTTQQPHVNQFPRTLSGGPFYETYEKSEYKFLYPVQTLQTQPAAEKPSVKCIQRFKATKPIPAESNGTAGALEVLDVSINAGDDCEETEEGISPTKKDTTVLNSTSAISEAQDFSNKSREEIIPLENSTAETAESDLLNTSTPKPDKAFETYEISEYRYVLNLDYVPLFYNMSNQPSELSNINLVNETDTKETSEINSDSDVDSPQANSDLQPSGSSTLSSLNELEGTSERTGKRPNYEKTEETHDLQFTSDTREITLPNSNIHVSNATNTEVKYDASQTEEKNDTGDEYSAGKSFHKKSSEQSERYEETSSKITQNINIQDGNNNGERNNQPVKLVEEGDENNEGLYSTNTIEKQLEIMMTNSSMSNENLKADNELTETGQNKINHELNTGKDNSQHSTGQTETYSESRLEMSQNIVIPNENPSDDESSKPNAEFGDTNFTKGQGIETKNSTRDGEVSIGTENKKVSSGQTETYEETRSKTTQNFVIQDNSAGVGNDDIKKPSQEYQKMLGGKHETNSVNVSENIKQSEVQKSQAREEVHKGEVNRTSQTEEVIDLESRYNTQPRDPHGEHTDDSKGSQQTSSSTTIDLNVSLNFNPTEGPQSNFTEKETGTKRNNAQEISDFRNTEIQEFSQTLQEYKMEPLNSSTRMSEPKQPDELKTAEPEDVKSKVHTTQTNESTFEITISETNQPIDSKLEDQTPRNSVSEISTTEKDVDVIAKKIFPESAENKTQNDIQRTNEEIYSTNKTRNSVNEYEETTNRTSKNVSNSNQNVNQQAGRNLKQGPAPDSSPKEKNPNDTRPKVFRNKPTLNIETYDNESEEDYEFYEIEEENITTIHRKKSPQKIPNLNQVQQTNLKPLEETQTNRSSKFEKTEMEKDDQFESVISNRTTSPVKSPYLLGDKSVDDEGKKSDLEEAIKTTESFTEKIETLSSLNDSTKESIKNTEEINSAVKTNFKNSFESNATRNEYLNEERKSETLNENIPQVKNFPQTDVIRVHDLNETEKYIKNLNKTSEIVKSSVDTNYLKTPSTDSNFINKSINSNQTDANQMNKSTAISGRTFQKTDKTNFSRRDEKIYESTEQNTKTATEQESNFADNGAKDSFESSEAQSKEHIQSRKPYSENSTSFHESSETESSEDYKLEELHEVATTKLHKNKGNESVQTLQNLQGNSMLNKAVEDNNNKSSVTDEDSEDMEAKKLQNTSSVVSRAFVKSKNSTANDYELIYSSEKDSNVKSEKNSLKDFNETDISFKKDKTTVKRIQELESIKNSDLVRLQDTANTKLQKQVLDKANSIDAKDSTTLEDEKSTTVFNGETKDSSVNKTIKMNFTTDTGNKKWSIKDMMEKSKNLGQNSKLNTIDNSSLKSQKVNSSEVPNKDRSRNSSDETLDSTQRKQRIEDNLQQTVQNENIADTNATEDESSENIEFVYSNDTVDASNNRHRVFNSLLMDKKHKTQESLNNKSEIQNSGSEKNSQRNETNSFVTSKNESQSLHLNTSSNVSDSNSTDSIVAQESRKLKFISNRSKTQSSTVSKFRSHLTPNVTHRSVEEKSEEDIKDSLFDDAPGPRSSRISTSINSG